MQTSNVLNCIFMFQIKEKHVCCSISIICTHPYTTQMNKKTLIECDIIIAKQKWQKLKKKCLLNFNSSLI